MAVSWLPFFILSNFFQKLNIYIKLFIIFAAHEKENHYR